MHIYYVYAYIRKSNGTPYYIGKGKDKRAFQFHNGISVPKDKSKIVFLETNLTDLGALALERRYIRWWGRKDLGTGILLNKTDGGEGPSGATRSNETKAKISSVWKGRHHSEKSKDKISKSKTGKQFTEDHCKNISKSKKGRKVRPMSEETKDKIRKAKLGKKRSPYKKRN